jgi:predicted ABC-type ATPase
MGQPVFYLLAGPNGAGKSPLYRARVLASTISATAEFVNADLYEAERRQHMPEWARRVLGIEIGL